MPCTSYLYFSELLSASYISCLEEPHFSNPTTIGPFGWDRLTAQWVSPSYASGSRKSMRHSFPMPARFPTHRRGLWLCVWPLHTHACLSVAQPSLPGPRWLAFSRLCVMPVAFAVSPCLQF